jgi:oligoendopeptidase F
VVNFNKTNILTKMARQIMATFSERTLKLLNDYKRMILKRYISPEERKQTINELGLKRKSLKFETDVILYNKAHRVLKNIENWTGKLGNTATEHSGIDEFYQHLKKFLNDFHIAHGRVVHITQAASRAVVQTIQVLSLPEPKLSKEAHKLDDLIQTIIKFGTSEHHAMLSKAMDEHKDSDSSILSPVLKNFTKYQARVEEEFLRN